MTRVIDEMPTLRDVETADPYQIVCWQLFLRPTMSNDELPIVKAIARRYDAMAPAVTEPLAARARREFA